MTEPSVHAARLALAALLAAPLPLAAQAPAERTAVLDVRFEGIETAEGAILLSLFDSEAAHDAGGAPVRVAMAPIEGTTARASFAGLRPGEYAVKAFHDLDGDMKMASNPFGMPLEPYAFSNDAVAQGEAPRWPATRFAVAPGANTVTIRIK